MRSCHIIYLSLYGVPIFPDLYSSNKKETQLRGSLKDCLRILPSFSVMVLIFKAVVKALFRGNIKTRIGPPKKAPQKVGPPTNCLFSTDFKG